MDMQVRCPRRGNYVSGARSGLVSGLRYLFENGNSKNFSQYFLSKLGFYKLNGVSVDLFMPKNFFWIFGSEWFFKSKCGF